MTTLTDLVAAVVVQSSAFAFSHFGIALETPKPPVLPASERVVARTHSKIEKLSACPERQRARVRHRAVRT